MLIGAQRPSLVVMQHEVANYEAWKKVFDSAADIRREAGERSYQVLRYDSDPRKISAPTFCSANIGPR